MLTFKDKAEEDFWKAIMLGLLNEYDYDYLDGSKRADTLVIGFRARQPAQEYPVLDDWIPHHGGRNPVPNQNVCVELRNGEWDNGPSAGFYWKNDGTSSDIVKYKVI